MGGNTLKYSKIYAGNSGIKFNVTIIVLSILVFALYFVKSFDFGLSSIIASVIAGIAVGFFITLFENHSLEFKPIRRRCSFGNHVVIKTLNFSIILAVFLSIAVFTLVGIDSLFNLTIFSFGVSHFFKHRFWEMLLISMAWAFSTNVFLEINRKLGPGLFFKIISGKYYEPQEEDRVFLFIDLNGSTQMAEKLGNVKFSHLLQDFFFDISDPVGRFGGEIYQYVGDEVVISWKFDKGIKDNNCIECFLALQQTINSLSDYYQKQYGVVPTFKGGMHSGKVVLAEIGKTKTEIAYHGDVLNTTSRITDFCKSLSRDFLISENLKVQLKDNSNYTYQHLGRFNLRGKLQAIDLYALEAIMIKDDVDSLSFELSLN